MIVLCPLCTRSYTALVTLIRAGFVFFLGLRSSALPPPLKSPRNEFRWFVLSPIKIKFHSILTNNFSPRSLDLWLLSASSPNTQESGQKGKKQQRGLKIGFWPSCLGYLVPIYLHFHFYANKELFLKLTMTLNIFKLIYFIISNSYPWKKVQRNGSFPQILVSLVLSFSRDQQKNVST